MSTAVDVAQDKASQIVDSLVDIIRDKLPTSTDLPTKEQIVESPFSYFFLFTLLLWLIRVIILKSLVALGRSNYAETLRITRRPVITDKQIERESIWIYGYGYDTIAMALIYYTGLLNSLPLYDNLLKAIFWMFVWHTIIVEPIYYAFHRLLHWQWFYKNFHQYHHKSIATEPTTGVSFEIYERVSYTILFAVSPLLVDYQGYQSYLAFTLYYIWFDIMNEGGHINFEPLPSWWLDTPFRYVFYSPTFHSVHHTKFKKNYSLFMPWTDILFGTAVYSNDTNKSLLPTTMATPQNKPSVDFVLLVHGANLESVLYSINLHPTFAPLFKFTHKLEHKIWMYIFHPYLWLVGFYITFLDKIGYHYEEEFPVTAIQDNSQNEFTPKKENFNGATWTIRNFGFQYLLPTFKKSIQDRIERAILDAASKNVKVVGLGNFNKAEWMNHGGSDIVEKYQDKLNGTYISHGDTLSAAVVYQYAMRLKEQGYWSNSVFVTGSTSKIGRAVVLSLANQHIRVVMYTQVKARFDEIAAEAGQNSSYLVFSSELSDGKSCDLWMTGKMIPRGKELLNSIPYGATVINFSVPDPLSPKLMKSRPDLLHLDTGLLAYNPKVMTPKFTWLLPKGVIYACLGGSIVHAILGIEAHEVGPVVVADMDKYWNAALALGFGIPPPSSFYSNITMPPPHKNLSISIV
jgi:sterol desaturase/sphingolipid hydroxylase (fatty acid hydroxylase superfamily)